MGKKIYVLDTNVPLTDPFSIFKFDNNEVIVPAVVLDELDHKKTQMDEIGRNARVFAKELDKLRQKGELSKGIVLDNGGIFRVGLDSPHKSTVYSDQNNDNRILNFTYSLAHDNHGYHKVILVSKDGLMRVKADAMGILAEDYLNDKIQFSDDHLYKGYIDILVEPDDIARFYHSGEIKSPIELLPNQFVFMKNICDEKSTAFGIHENGKIVKCKVLTKNEQVWGISPRNLQQHMAFELLLREDIPLVTMIGKAGTGKTLLALAAGLYQTEDLNEFTKLLVARPVVPLGKDLGFLPGEKEEKLRPWMQPIYDNLEFLFNTKKPGELDNILAGMGSIQVEALTYIRGRSIPEQFIIIDEAQNLTKHEVKTILTRVGEKSKIVLMGDPQQIDHQYLDEHNNGLSYVVEKFKDQAISGHITLEKGERSGLAKLAADLL